MMVIENENSKVTLTDDKLFIAEYKDGIKLEKKDLEIVVNNYDNNTNEEMWKVLHIFPKGTSVTSEARDYAEEREKPALAEAFVIEGMGNRILFRFYQKFRAVKYPIKEFKDRETAMKWLDQI